MGMRLQEFIKDAIVQIMEGMNAADGELNSSGIGSIYKDEYAKTMAQTLVNLAIVKGRDDKGVLILGFDVAVAVQEQTDECSEVNGSAGGAFLSVVGLKAGIAGKSAQMQTSSNSHRITLSVPVTFDTYGES